jgi:hypothetical protein
MRLFLFLFLSFGLNTLQYCCPVELQWCFELSSWDKSAVPFPCPMAHAAIEVEHQLQPQLCRGFRCGGLSSGTIDRFFCTDIRMEQAQTTNFTPTHSCCPGLTSLFDGSTRMKTKRNYDWGLPNTCGTGRSLHRSISAPFAVSVVMWAEYRFLYFSGSRAINSRDPSGRFMMDLRMPMAQFI